MAVPFLMLCVLRQDDVKATLSFLNKVINSFALAECHVICLICTAPCMIDVHDNHICLFYHISIAMQNCIFWRHMLKRRI